MISIQLPDGSRREYPGPVTVEQVAASIGPGLAKAALGGRIGEGKQGKLVDTSFTIDHDERLAIVTEKDADGLELIRHSAAHLLAYAVKNVGIERSTARVYTTSVCGAPSTGATGRSTYEPRCAFCNCPLTSVQETDRSSAAHW